MNLIEIGPKLKLMAIGRWDKYTFKNTSLSSPVPNDTKPFLPNIGITYALVKDLNIYGSWNKGFLPQNNQSPDNGGPFDPEYSEQVEAGAKKQFFNNHFTTTIAYYEIKRENVLVPKDAVNAPFGLKVAAGTALSKGVEFNTAGDLLPNWSINAGYAYNASYVTYSTYGIDVKRQANNAPFTMANLFTRYNFTSNILKGLGIAGGFRYVGGRTTDGSTAFPAPLLVKLPDYTVADAAIYYRSGNVTYSANLDNVFNKRYVGGASNAFYLQPGKPRNVMARVQFTF